jgi:hypothetical protein
VLLVVSCQVLGHVDRHAQTASTAAQGSQVNIAPMPTAEEASSIDPPEIAEEPQSSLPTRTDKCDEDYPGVVIDGSLAELLCNDAELRELNQRDRELHEERIRVEGEARRGPIQANRAALVGILWTCGAFGPRRECIVDTLSGDISLLERLIEQDRQQASDQSAPTTSSDIQSPSDGSASESY